MKISELCDLNSGFQGKLTPGEDYKIIKLKDLSKDGVINYEDLEGFNSNKVNDKYLLKKNDIILKAKSGDNTAALIREEVKNVVAASHFIVIKVKDPKILNPEYLVAYLNSEYAKHYFKKNAEGSTLPILKIKNLEGLDIKDLSMDKQLEVSKIYNLIKEEKLVMEMLIENREKQFKAYLRNLLEEE